jgi:hypothetical protein
MAFIIRTNRDIPILILTDACIQNKGEVVTALK